VQLLDLGGQVHGSKTYSTYDELAHRLVELRRADKEVVLGI
jgi:hypothetical protein